MLPRVDLVKVNEDEARLLTGSDDPATSGKILLENGPTMVILTHEPRAVTTSPGQSQVLCQLFLFRQWMPLDVGDSFIGGILNRLTLQPNWRSQLSQYSLDRAFRFASAVGAITATRTGAIPAMPRLPEVDAFLFSHS